MPQLSQPITYRTLLSFAVPMMISQVFMNINFIVDGIFVAHAVGTDGLSAINIVLPSLLLTIVCATMFGTGRQKKQGWSARTICKIPHALLN